MSSSIKNGGTWWLKKLQILTGPAVRVGPGAVVLSIPNARACGSAEEQESGGLARKRHYAVNSSRKMEVNC